MFATSGERSSPACVHARFSSMMPSARKKPSNVFGKSRRSRPQLLRRRHRLHRLWCARLNRQAGLGHAENTAGSVKLRDREAAARASQQRERQQSQAAEQALREKESTERAAQARQRQLEVEKGAQARRAKREQEKADAAANGHKPAATCLRLLERR